MSMEQDVMTNASGLTKDLNKEKSPVSLNPFNPWGSSGFVQGRLAAEHALEEGTATKDQQILLVESLASDLPSDVRAAIAMGNMGVNMGDRQEDGSVSYPLDAVVAVEAMHLGIVNQDGSYNAEGAGKFGDGLKGFDDFDDADKQRLNDVFGVNQYLVTGGMATDAGPLTEMQMRGALSALDASSDMNGKVSLFAAVPSVTERYMHLFSDYGDAMAQSMVSLDGQAMQAYDQYQVLMEAAKNGTLTKEMMDGYQMAATHDFQAGLDGIGAAAGKADDIMLAQGMTNDDILDSSFFDQFQDSMLSGAAVMQGGMQAGLDAAESAADVPDEELSGMTEESSVDAESPWGHSSPDGICKDAPGDVPSDDRAAQAEEKFGDILQQSETQSEMEME